MKPVFDRTIGGSTSYPSGHTTAAFALGAAFVLVLASSRGRRWMPAPARGVALCRSLDAGARQSLVGLGMVAWREHYLTDTFGGAAVGIGTISARLVALCRRSSHGRRRAPLAVAAGACLGS